MGLEIAISEKRGLESALQKNRDKVRKHTIWDVRAQRRVIGLENILFEMIETQRHILKDRVGKL